MKSDESIATLLKYAGYFAADGYKNSLRVIRQAGREYSVATVDAKDFTRFQMCDGDEVTADPILERFTNRLEVKGAVYRPGIYELSGSLNTVKQLVEKPTVCWATPLPTAPFSTASARTSPAKYFP